jgi:DNA-binding transcriptional LysR family regulator
VSLDLSDRVVDLVNEGFDCAVRLGALADSSLVSLRLAENRRVCVAAPSYLAEQGTPMTLEDLGRHRCLVLGANANQQRGWTFSVDDKTTAIKVSGAMECSDGAVLREWCVAGHGLAWRSWWEVGSDVVAGRLVTVLDAFAAPPIVIHAVFPERRHLPLRVRLFLDALRDTFQRPGYWD